MKTLFVGSKWVMCAAALVMAACGDPVDDEKAEAKCPAVEGDRHLAEGKATPGGLNVMVHVVGRECLVTGENRLHLYEIGSKMAMGMQHSAFDPSSMLKTDSLTISAVKATMPAMGHGTAQEPALQGGGAFSIAFQMPGAWQLEVEFTSPATTTVQTASFAITVQ